MNNQLMGLNRTLKREAIKALIQIYTGEEPIVKEYSEYDEISFTPGQVQTLQKVLSDWNKSKPSDVRINTAPVLLPWSIKTYGKYLAAVVGVSALIGYLLKR